MRCLILGGGGFLGSHLCDALLAEGYAVRIFDRPNLIRYRKFKSHEQIEWVEGDFVNVEDVSRAVSGCNIVYHLVSTTLPSSSNQNPAYDVETNVMGTLQLLEAAKHQQVKKVIFVSSGGTVYGMPQHIPITEAHATEPICSYGIGKLTIEKYLNLYHRLHGVNYGVLRMANPFGERQRISSAQGAIAAFLYKALRDEEIEIWGDGTVIRDYFHVGDAVSALLKVINYQGTDNVFNIGSGVGRSLNEILAAIESLLGIPVKRTYLQPRPFDVPVNILDISKASSLLGWSPKIKFSEGLSRTAEWMRDNNLELFR